MKNVGYYNGTIGLIDEITVPMNDRAVYFGDGVYDAGYIKNHKPFALYDHIDRFFNSCSLIGIKFNMTKAELDKLLRKLINMVDADECMLYWQASRGTAPRGHAFPSPETPPNLLAYVTPKKVPDPNKKLKLLTVDDERYLLCHIKTLNLIPNVLANQKSAEAGCDEAIFHRGDRVTEGSHSNISILKDGAFRTAPLDKLILPGTVRKHIIAICYENDIPVIEEPFSLSELMGADEIIVSSATALIRSANEIDGIAVGGKADKLLKFVQAKYSEKIDKETKDTVAF